jgi:hypothetical protein
MSLTMTMSPAAIRTARRNLVQAIERFIRSAGNAELTLEQLTNLREALDALEAGNYPTGEDAVFLAEKGWSPRTAAVETGLSLADLVERFKRLRAE